MAHPEQDLVDEDLRSSLNDCTVGSSVSTSGGGFSSDNINTGNINTGSSSSQDILCQPSEISEAACPEEEPFQDQVTIRIAGSGGQADGGQAHEPRPDARDKGKAPMRAGGDCSDRTNLINAESSNANLHVWSLAANNSKPAQNQEELQLPAVSNATPADGRDLDESDTAGVGSEYGNGKEAVPESFPASQQKQKQKAEPEHDPGPQPQTGQRTATTGESNINKGPEAPVFRPLQPGDLGWEKSADRPPRKLPIRFKDAVGRKFLFPWEKAKTWAGMERLVQSCFLHVDIIGPHVNAGHYDLIACFPFSMDPGSEMGLHGVSSAPPQPPPPPEAGAIDPQTSGPPGEPAIPQAPTPPPAVPSTPVQQSAVIILPELWEDLIEPGMAITMAMWPLDSPHPPPPPLPHPPGPPGPIHHPFVPGLPARGRGRGRGGGRGMGPMMGPMPGPVPPLRPWMVIDPPKPRGKTRKRQDGHGS